MFSSMPQIVSSAGTMIKSLGIFEWSQILQIMNGVISSANLFSHMYSGNDIPSDVYNKLTRERDGAVQCYKLARTKFNEKIYEEALNLLKNAIVEYKKIDDKSIINLSHVDKYLYAEILKFTGIVYFYQGKSPEQALHFLSRSLTLYPDVLASNICAFICIYQFKNEKRGMDFVKQSLNSDPNQITANFFKDKLEKNPTNIKKQILKLESVLKQRENTPENERKKIGELNNLEATMLPMFIPYMIADWIEYYSAHEPDSNKLAEAANTYSELLASMDATQEVLNNCATMVLEKRIQLLQTISKKKKYQTDISSRDKEWVKAYSVQVGEEERYFIQYDIKWYGHAVDKFFPNKDFQGIFDDLQRQYAIELIVAWLQSGLIDSAYLEDHLTLKKKLKELKHLNGDKKKEKIAEIHDYCSSDNIIKYFLENAVQGKDQLSWFRVAPINAQNGINYYCLLRFFCRQNNVNLFVYEMQNDVLIPTRAYGVGDDEVIADNPSLHVVLKPGGTEFTLLHELNTPSRIYRWIALKDCFSLIERDPTNKVALTILKARKVFMAPRLEAEHRLMSVISNYSDPNLPTEYDLVGELSKIGNLEVELYSDFAKLLLARLYVCGVNLTHENMNVAIEIINNLNFSHDPKCNALQNLVLAEGRLNGYTINQRLYRTDPEKAIQLIRKCFEDLNLIGVNEPLTPTKLQGLINSKNLENNFVERYIFGYAAALLSRATTNKDISQAYLRIAQELRFIKLKLEIPEQNPELFWNKQHPARNLKLEMQNNIYYRICELFGIPVCVANGNASLKLLRQSLASVHDAEAFFRFLHEIRYSSKLNLTLEAYIYYSIERTHNLISPAECQGGNGVLDIKIDELFQAIEANNQKNIESALLKLEISRPEGSEFRIINAIRARGNFYYQLYHFAKMAENREVLRSLIYLTRSYFPVNTDIDTLDLAQLYALPRPAFPEFFASRSRLMFGNDRHEKIFGLSTPEVFGPGF